MSNFASRRPGMRSNTERNYVAVESRGHNTAEPILTICLDKNNLVYGVSSDQCRKLSDADREAILVTIKKILDERR